MDTRELARRIVEAGGPFRLVLHSGKVLRCDGLLCYNTAALTVEIRGQLRTIPVSQIRECKTATDARLP